VEKMFLGVKGVRLKKREEVAEVSLQLSWAKLLIEPLQLCFIEC